MKCFIAVALLVCVSLVRAEPPAPNQSYLPPNQQVQQPNSQYLPPSQQYQAPSSNYLPPQRGSQAPSNTYQAPSSTYGAPAVTGAIFSKAQGGNGGGYGGNRGGSQSGYGNREEENYGPAKYEFKYDVQDYESGNDFGHMESRDGDYTVERYYVLLPDGRKQIVDYEADQNGYRPTIRYEQVGNGNGNGNGKAGNGNGGYNNNAQPQGFGGYQ